MSSGEALNGVVLGDNDDDGPVTTTTLGDKTKPLALGVDTSTTFVDGGAACISS